MCGIAGLFSLRPVAAEDLWRMTRPLEHRGPDAQGIWLDEAAGLGFGHARLAVIDVSPMGAQPMVSHGGRYAITYNGEIYNAEELRRQLGEPTAGVAWRGHSDTEVLLAAIERWGLETTLRKAEGMFAFALWDRATRRLALARDRSGEKPLYYGLAGRSFVFGSELKVLRAALDFDPELDYAATARFSQLGYVPAPYSIYRNARKLPAGAFLQLGPEDLQERRWPEPQRFWSIQEVASEGMAAPLDDETAAIRQLDETLRAAVKAQMCADVPLGAFLSGGIDSSTVVAMMQAQAAAPVRTFTVAFKEPGYDESAIASGVARHLGTDHTELEVTSKDALAVVPLLSRIYDEPFADASQIPTYLISTLARRHVTVALSGDGGDELFGGYNRYLWLPGIVRATAKLPPVAARCLASAVDRAPQTVLGAAARFRGPIGQLARRADALPEMLRARGSADAYRGAVHHWPSAPLSDEPARRRHVLAEAPLDVTGDPRSDMMVWDYLTYLPDDVLTKVDRASMRTSLEVRCPLLQPQVAQLAWRLPMSMKIRGSTGKWLLRQVLYRYVPESLVNQPKAGFAAPIGSWLRGPLRDWADDLLSETRLRRQGVFDAELVGAAWRAHRAGRRDVSKRLWPILMFGSWFDEWSGPAPAR